MRARLIGATAIIALAIVGATLLRRWQPAAPSQNEAVAVIPSIAGIRAGTRVSYGSDRHPYLGRIGEVDIVERRGDSMVVRIRFDRERGLVRRRGDAVKVVSSRGEKSLMLVGAPTYEKPGSVSDTLRLAHANGDRPESAEALLAGLYRARRGALPDSSSRR
jgi:hypothetical protein